MGLGSYAFGVTPTLGMFARPFFIAPLATRNDEATFPAIHWARADSHVTRGGI